jgi:hypothetical protein
MPSRFVSLAILVYWSIAAFCLLTWDVIPDLSLGYPPDLRAIAFAGDLTKPVKWSVQVVDDPKALDARRIIGEALTLSTHRPDGWYELTSHVELDAGGLLRGTPFATRTSIRLRIDSRYHVDPSGNLQKFDLQVRSQEFAEELFQVKGNLRGKTMEIVADGPMPILKKHLTFDYEPRSVVHDVLGPLDRLPGLHVGQRWDTRVINPFSGQVDRVRVEVTRQSLIHWGGDTVTAFEVTQHLGPLSMKTWVRTDGVILRQEVPIPFIRLVLERQPDESVSPTSQAKGRSL